MKKRSYTENQEYIIGKLASVGIIVEKGEKKPINGTYSGIIGTKKGERVINIPFYPPMHHK